MARDKLPKRKTLKPERRHLRNLVASMQRQGKKIPPATWLAGVVGATTSTVQQWLRIDFPDLCEDFPSIPVKAAPTKAPSADQNTPAVTHAQVPVEPLTPDSEVPF